MKKFIGFVLLMGVFAAALLGVAGWFWWNVGTLGADEKVQVHIPNGAGMNRIANILQQKGIVRWPFLFRIYAGIHGQDTSVQAGVYAFEGPMTPEQVLEKLISGDVLYARFVIPEGWSQKQILQRILESFPDSKLDDWKKALQDPSLKKKIPFEIPADSNLEGYLFPDTYTFAPDVSPKEVLGLMVDSFAKHYKAEVAEQLKPMGLTPHQWVTMASIVEKETGQAEERPHIAAVFLNRLRIHMRLQTDPTVIYGLGDRFDGNLRKKDLETMTPYNTYLVAGLPPGPIASPGKAALEAVLHPLEGSKDLYFVAKGDGTHHFSASLEEHNRAVQKYQLGK